MPRLRRCRPQQAIWSLRQVPKPTALEPGTPGPSWPPAPQASAKQQGVAVQVTDRTANGRGERTEIATEPHQQFAARCARPERPVELRSGSVEVTLRKIAGDADHH